MTVHGPGTVRATFRSAYDTVDCSDIATHTPSITLTNLTKDSLPVGTVFLFKTRTNSAANSKVGRAQVLGYIGSDATASIILKWTAYDPTSCAIAKAETIDTLDSELGGAPPGGPVGVDLDGSVPNDVVWLRIGSAVGLVSLDNLSYPCRFYRLAKGE